MIEALCRVVGVLHAAALLAVASPHIDRRGLEGDDAAVGLVHGDGQVDLLVRCDLTATRSPEVEAYLANHPPAEAAQ